MIQFPKSQNTHKCHVHVAIIKHTWWVGLIIFYLLLYDSTNKILCQCLCCVLPVSKPANGLFTLTRHGVPVL